MNGSQITIGNSEHRDKVIEVNKKVAHGFGPIDPTFPLFQSEGVDVEVKNLHFCLIYSIWQFEFLRIFPILGLQNVIGKTINLTKQSLYHLPKLFRPVKTIRFLASYQHHFSQVPLQSDIIESFEMVTILQGDEAQSHQQMPHSHSYLLPNHLLRIRTLPHGHILNESHIVLNSNPKKQVDHAGSSQLLKHIHLDLFIEACVERLLFQLRPSFLNFVDVLPKFVFLGLH